MFRSLFLDSFSLAIVNGLLFFTQHLPIFPRLLFLQRLRSFDWNISQVFFLSLFHPIGIFEISPASRFEWPPNGLWNIWNCFYVFHFLIRLLAFNKHVVASVCQKNILISQMIYSSRFAYLPGNRPERTSTIFESKSWNFFNFGPW